MRKWKKKQWHLSENRYKGFNLDVTCVTVTPSSPKFCEKNKKCPNIKCYQEVMFNNIGNKSYKLLSKILVEGMNFIMCDTVTMSQGMKKVVFSHWVVTPVIFSNIVLIYFITWYYYNFIFKSILILLAKDAINHVRCHK